MKALRNWHAYYVTLASLILIITGGLKVWGAFGDSEMLKLADPIFGLPFRHLMWFVGILEIVVAVFCLCRRQSYLSIYALVWLTSSFVIYRIALKWVGWKKPCSCLGNLTDALYISPQTADNIMKVVLTYLLIGSYFLLIRQWRRDRPANRKQSTEI